MKPPTGICLRLLGRWSLAFADDATAIRLSTRKSGALLAYLTMRPEQTATREELATLLWGGCSDQQARQSLRQALALLRKELRWPQFFTADNEVVRLRPGLWSVDALDFEAYSKAINPKELQRAARLFGGEFLSGLNIDEEGFNEWVGAQRQRMQIAAARLCETYAIHPELVVDGQEAIAAAERLVAIEPLREDWQRISLTLYARYRGVQEALAQAEVFAGTLQRELGVVPEKETRDLLERIRRGEIVRLSALIALPDAPADSTDIAKASFSFPVVSADHPAQALASRGAAPSQMERHWSPRVIASGLALAGVIVSGLWFSGHAGRDTDKSVDLASASQRNPSTSQASPAANRVIEGPTRIAVLPFSALGEKAESMQWIADTLTDDLTNMLSRTLALRVISRQSMLRYRGTSLDIAAVGSELNVHYVLEGSVRTEGEKLRVNVALIDPSTRSPVWSTRIERQNNEQSTVRDEIIGRMARELALGISAVEVARALENPGIRDLNYKGWSAIYASGASIDTLWRAEEAFTQALALDPHSKNARIGLGTFHALAGIMWLDGDGPGHFAKAESILLPIIQASPGGTGAHFAMGLVYEARGNLPKAIEAFQHTVEYNPSHAPSYAGLGHALIASGKAAEGLEHIRYAMRLSPHDAQQPHWLRFAAEAELELGHLPDAVSYIRRSEALGPHQPQTLRTLAVILATVGRMDEARGYLAELQNVSPSVTAERMLRYRVALAVGQPELLRGLQLLTGTANTRQSLD